VSLSDRDLPEGTSSVSRRTFMHGVVASAVVAGVADFTISGGAMSVPETGVNVLTPNQHRVLAVVLNRLIPPNDAMPGAGDLGVGRFIEQLLASAPHLAPHLRPLLDVFPNEQVIGRIANADIDATLRTLETEQGESFDLLVQAAYNGYYGHARVQELLTWADPVDSGGRIPETLDSPILTTVRERGAKVASLMATQIESISTFKVS
jgi:hypothetical protein